MSKKKTISRPIVEAALGLISKNQWLYAIAGTVAGYFFKFSLSTA
jgi:hypothetical protein